jgi:cell division protein FtsN
MKSFFVIALLLVFTFCATDYSRRVIEIPNKSPIALKDYETLGIISDEKTKVVEWGKTDGSEITYEGLISKAKEKYGDAVDDVINIRIDCHEISNWRRTTYNYTASALAIKYTTAIVPENITNYIQNTENHDITINKTNTSLERPQPATSPPDVPQTAPQQAAPRQAASPVYVPPPTPPQPAAPQQVVTQTVIVNASPQTAPSTSTPLVEATTPLPSAVSGVRLIPPLNPQPDKTYKLQVGAYNNIQNAEREITRLKDAGFNMSYERGVDKNGCDIYRVVLLGVPETEVQSVKEKLKAANCEVLIKENG